MKICSMQVCVAAALAALWAAPAAAQVYRCEENGVPLFQNSPNGKNCRKLDLQPLMTIPAPQVPAAGGGRAAAAGSASGTTGGASSGSAASGGAASGGAPAAGPGALRVDAATQRARDSDRRRIIEDELRREEQRLGEARREFNNGEPERRADERNYQKYLDRVEQLKADIARGEGNVALLRRELGALRD